MAAQPSGDSAELIKPGDRGSLACVAGIEFWRRPYARDRGTPFVCLHGIGSNLKSFMPLLASLPSDVDALAWNAPGYGHSVELKQPKPSPRDYADALNMFLDGLGIASCVLVGHSLGALFAASFAAAYPRRVRGLALISPAIGYGIGQDEPLPANVQLRLTELESLGPAAFGKKRAARLLSDPSGRPEVLDAVESAMAAVRPSGYAQATHALAAGTLTDDLAHISVPVLVAVGTDDVVTPPSNAQMARDAAIGAVSYHEINGAGHALPQEAPEVVARLLVNFSGDLS